MTKVRVKIIQSSLWLHTAQFYNHIYAFRIYITWELTNSQWRCLSPYSLVWSEVVRDTVHSDAENFLFCWKELAVQQGTNRSAKQAVTPLRVVCVTVPP